MTPSENYIENWEKANKWLQENAPKYVIDSIKEETEVLQNQNYILSLIKSLPSSTGKAKCMKCNMIDILLKSPECQSEKKLTEEECVEVDRMLKEFMEQKIKEGHEKEH